MGQMMFQTLIRVMEPADWLKIRCDLCGYQVEWRRAKAFEAFGPDASPADCRARLVCGNCGSRAKVRVWV